MSFYHVLFHSSILSATLVYFVLVILFEIASSHLLHKISDVKPSHWITEHIMVPFVHVVLLVGFIFLCYPILFGITEAPPLSELLNTSDGQLMKLINIVFIVSVILPLIPVIGNLTALILPIQAIAAAATIFSWYNTSIAADYHLLPTINVLLLIIILSIIAHFIANQLATHLSPFFDERYHTNDADSVINKICLLLFQIPILLIYTMNLTR